MKEKTKGVIYIATGKRYVDEALVSAASLKKHIPNLPITLFTDVDVKSKYIDNVVKINNPKYTFEDKVRYINKSPYDYTIYLDTDTYLCDDVSELFDLFDKFDMAIARFPMEEGSNINGIPKSFVLLDTGIILFKKSSKTKKFFLNWAKLYQSVKKGSVNLGFIKKNKSQWIKKGIHDAPIFSKIIYNSKIRFTTLTKGYYFRGKCGFVNSKVKIIHYRRRDFNLIDKTINSSLAPRIYLWQDGKLHVFGMPKNNPEESKRIKAYISGGDHKDHSKDLVNYLNKIMGVWGIFLKKYFPKVYYLLKR